MKYPLREVSFRDRFRIKLRYFGLLATLFAIVTSLEILVTGSLNAMQMWMLVAGTGFCILMIAVEARGPNDTGFLDFSGAMLTRDHNGEKQSIDLSAVTEARYFNIFGNKSISLKMGSESADVLYSSYSGAVLHEFRCVLGVRLRKGTTAEFLRELMGR